MSVAVIEPMYTYLSQRPLIFVPLTLFLLLLCWRIWRFTFRPLLHPDDPLELPYWIPVLGHIKILATGLNSLTESATKYFANPDEPWTLTVSGMTIYIIGNPKDASAVFRNSATINLNPVNDNMFARLGVSAKSRNKMLYLEEGKKYRYNEKNVKDLTPQEMIIELHRQQIFPGKRFDDLFETKFLPGIISSLQLENLKRQRSVVKQTGSTVSLSLLKFCEEVFIGVTTSAFFGKAIFHVQPEMVRWWVEWERVCWKHLYVWPKLLSRDMLTAKSTILRAFLEYFKMPSEERQDRSHFIMQLEELLREVGLSEEEMAGVMMLQYWAIVGNVYKLAFWLVSHLAYDDVLLEAIRTETQPAIRGNAVDEEMLLERTPLLNSLFAEVLRMRVTSPLSRVLTKSIVIGGKLLKESNNIMVPFRDLHRRKDVWGHKSDELEPDRFQVNPKLAKSPSYRPWGGGHTLCPGRYLAKRTLFAFIALLLAKYDVERSSGGLHGRSGFPRGDSVRPSAGVEDAMEGEDVMLALNLRDA